MKKWLCLTLVFVMLLGLVACGESGKGTAGSEKKEFRIGFGRVDITPAGPVHLASYGDADTRISEGALHQLFAHAIVMKDEEGDTMIMITTDLSQGGNHTIMNELRPMLTEKFGVEKNRIVIGGTHNHNAPDYGYNDKYDLEWKDVYKNGCIEAVQQAMNDLAPATVEIGRTETENVTFVRRYVLENGEYTGDNFNMDFTSPIKDHESEADEEIQLVRYVREGDKKDIVMVNWQAHAAKHGHTNYLSADYPGPLRDKVEKELGVHCIFYQGACGNLNPSSRIHGEAAVDGGGYQKAVAVGELVADYVIKALNTEGLMKQINTGKIDNKQDNFIGKDSFDETNTITCGELSFVTLPVEFFDSLGKQIKDETPYEMTVLMGFHCGNGQYLATKEAYDHGGYEPRNSRYRAGEGEKFTQFYIDTLKAMYQAENPQ